MKRKVLKWTTALCIFCMLILCFNVWVYAASAPELSAASVELVKGFDKTLKINHVSGKKVTWKTSKKSVVSIKKKSNTQVVLQAGKKTGTAVVTAKVGKKSYTCKVTVKDWNCQASNGTKIEAGKSTVLSSKQAKLTRFSSSNKSVATVTKNGKITGKKKGSCYISFYAGRYAYKVKFTVSAKKVAPELSIGAWTYQGNGKSKFVSTWLKAGKTGTLEIKNSEAGIVQDLLFYVNGAYLKTDMEFSSTNPSVLSFDNRDGVFYTFYSLQDGSTTLKIRYQGFTYSVKVKISDTDSRRYEQQRNAIYQSLNINASTPDQYACFQLAAWICDHTAYDHDRVQSSKGMNATYKDFFNHVELICSGYADLYMYLCSGLGIPCRQTGSEAMNHVWNQVQIDGAWYNVDVCWMDAAKNGMYSMQYFLVSDACMKKYSSSHLAADRFKVSNTRFDGCCEEQMKIQNEQLRREYSTLFDNYSDVSPWMTGTWRNY